MPPDSLTGGLGMTDLINDFAFHRLMICLKTVSPKISGSSTWLKGLRNNCKRVAIFWIMSPHVAASLVSALPQR